MTSQEQEEEENGESIGVANQTGQVKDASGSKVKRARGDMTWKKKQDITSRQG